VSSSLELLFRCDLSRASLKIYRFVRLVRGRRLRADVAVTVTPDA